MASTTPPGGEPGELAGTVKYALALGQQRSNEGTPYSTLVNTCVTEDGRQVGFSLTGEPAEAFHNLATRGSTVRLRGTINGSEFVVDAFDVGGGPNHVFSIDQSAPDFEDTTVDLDALYQQDVYASQVQEPAIAPDPGQRSEGPVPEPVKPEPDSKPELAAGDIDLAPPVSAQPMERPIHRRQITGGVLTI